MFRGAFPTPVPIILSILGLFLHILGCLRHDPVKKMFTISEVYIPNIYIYILISLLEHILDQGESNGLPTVG